MIGMLSALANIMHGELVGPDKEAVCAGFDSRSAKEGMLFFALKDVRDGHEFAADAEKKGAVAAVVRKDAVNRYAMPSSYIMTEDPLKALHRLAAWHREKLSPVVIAVTGSNGKTTVKGMIASILKAAYPNASYSTPGNFNNDIGVPLSLLGLTPEHKAAVIEIGMNHPGEVHRLAALTRPKIALVNNAQREHMEFFKSVRDVADSNGEVFAHTDPDGVAVLNADDAFYDRWKEMASPRKTLSFGLSKNADVIAESYQLLPTGSRFVLKTPQGTQEVVMAAVGKHNVQNALAAAACAEAAGIGLDAVKQGLNMFSPVKGRLNVKQSKNGATIIDDTYNANPDSIAAAIAVLASYNGYKLLILGDMGEVGDNAVPFHQEIGRLAKESGIDAVWTIGKLARETARAFGEGGVHFDDKSKLLAHWETLSQSLLTALVKGSRFMAMDTLISSLCA